MIGGGVIGCSVAYHLARSGCSDVLLLERRQITSGTTWHAAGLLGQLRQSVTMTNLARYTSELYARLEQETGQSTGYLRCGSFSVTADPERFEELRRAASLAKVLGLPVNVVTAKTIGERVPLLETSDLLGGLHIPGDGYASPTDVTLALAAAARSAGARIVEQVPVTSVRTAGGRVMGVATEQGDIDADCVVLCAGMWTRELAASIGVNVPLHACEHYYVRFDDVEGLDANLPVVRDYDAISYFRYDAGKLIVGVFEPSARPWGMDGIPEDFCFDEIAANREHFEPLLRGARERMPALQSAEVVQLFCGPESFTPDVRYHVGPAPECENCFVAAGLNSIGIQSAGGIGKVISEWILEGHPPADLWEVDVRRNMPFQGNRRYLRERVSESLGLLYAMHYPYRQFETARGVRRSPLYDRLEAAGACHGELAGWERPNWYAPKGVPARYDYSYGRQNWFDYSAAEHRAVRENVGLFDQSSFAKFRLEGRDAAKVLNRVCANDVDVPPGRIVYTQWLNERGGIEADLTVTRLAEDSFLIVTATTSETRDFLWLKGHIPGDAHCVLTNVTALDSLRIEKAYRHWGHDITDQDSPLEAGLGFAVRFDKPGGFIGREALLRQKESGIAKRLIQFRLRDPQPLLYHNEPIWLGDEIAGYVTSGNYGHSLGAAVGLGYVAMSLLPDFPDLSGGFEIEVAGVRVPAEASLRPMYDPSGQRVRN